ncbi:hypothetical protein [Streptomyces griseoruber]|uniref:hypothetical protein n=1 Tax=Streptomyces griseoruber TaxID=1943 RepID=UPI00099F3587|nr:hypothetical protein [Streptomyces griseoruber]
MSGLRLLRYNQFHMGDAKQWRTLSALSITNEDTGWYTKSEITLPPGKGLPGRDVDIHTDNITWTGDAKEMKLRGHTGRRNRAPSSRTSRSCARAVTPGGRSVPGCWRRR